MGLLSRLAWHRQRFRGVHVVLVLAALEQVATHCVESQIALLGESVVLGASVVLLQEEHMSEVAIAVEDSNKMGDVSSVVEEKEKEKKKKIAESLVRFSVTVRRVILFLAALEQSTTYLGQIAFVGATVVLLGGYAPRLKLYDFQLISALLLTEGVRVVLANKFVEYSVAKRLAIYFSGPGICSWPLWVIVGFRDKHSAVRTIFQVLQVGSAAITFAFSLSRLKSGDYKPTLMSSPSDAGEVANFLYGIRLFYILTLVKSSVSLVVKTLWGLLILCTRASDSRVSSVRLPNTTRCIIGFAQEVYEVFITEGFGKASATNLFTYTINKILDGFDHCVETFDILCWQEFETTEGIKSLIRLTVAGVPCANKFLARAVVLRKISVNFLLAVLEFRRIPLEVVDIEVIDFLDYILTNAPLGVLSPETVSKQASEFLIQCIIEGDDKIQAQAALTFLKWWRNPTIYRRYVFDPADIFYRLFIHKQQQLSRPEDKFFLDIVHYSQLEALLGYEKIADPIRAVFTQRLELPRSDIMNKLLSRVDFSKLKNKQSTVNMSGILPDIISAVSPTLQPADFVIRLVAAWIWFMDKSTFQKAICKLSEEELGIVKNCAPIYEAILTSQKKEWFQEKELNARKFADLQNIGGKIHHRRASSS